MKRLLLFLLSLQLITGLLPAQQKQIDSLKVLLQNEKTDTITAERFIQLSGFYFYLQNDSAIRYAQKALTLAQKLQYEKGIAQALYNLGFGNYRLGKYYETLQNWNQSLELRKKMKDQPNSAKILGTIGAVYIAQNNFPKAMDYCVQALHLYEALHDRSGIALQQANIAVIHQYNNDYDKAIIAYQNVLNYYLEIKDKRGMALQTGNLASVYLLLKNYDKALEYYTRALQLFEEANDIEYQAMMICGIGAAHDSMKNFELAVKYYKKAVQLCEEGGMRAKVGVCYFNLGNVEVRMKNYKEGEEHLKKSLQIGKESGDLELQRNSYQSRCALDSVRGNFQDALLFHVLYTQLKDSIYSESKTKELTRYELNYEFQKKELNTRAEQEKKDAVIAAEQKKQKIIRYWFPASFFFLPFLLFFIFRSLTLTRKQKALIEMKSRETEEQKKIIEEKNKDITDSILYARRIQNALMPSDKSMQRHLSRLRDSKDLK